MFTMSISLQKDEDFVVVRLSGGEEYFEFIQRGTPTLGLTRILFLGFDAAAVWRGLTHTQDT